MIAGFNGAPARGINGTEPKGMTSDIKKLDVTVGASELSSESCDAVPLPVGAQGRIGNQLKLIYGQLLSEPLPDKFTKLLADLAGDTDGNEPESRK